MRIVVLGGTGFVGRWIVSELSEYGHQVLVVHRGIANHESDPSSTHLHGSRETFKDLVPHIRDFSPDGLVDVAAYSRQDAKLVLDSLTDDLRLLALSSMDVYRASGALRGHTSQDAVPLDESAPLRAERFIYRDDRNPSDEYEKLDVEEEYLARGATVLRLPMIYGAFDDSHREEFILRRCRAGRQQIPIGSGGLLWSRGYVRDVASAVRLSVEADSSSQIFNICESSTWTIGQWAREIAGTAGWTGEFVLVPDDVLPADMRLTRAFGQHLLVDSSKARRTLQWRETDPPIALKTSVRWHLANPPEAHGDFGGDELALSQAL